MMPRPNWAIRPTTVKSVVSVTFDASPSAATAMIVVACAVPEPVVLHSPNCAAWYQGRACSEREGRVLRRARGRDAFAVPPLALAGV